MLVRTCRNTLASSYAKKRMVQLNWVRSAKYQVNAPGSPRGSLRSRTPAAFTLIADELYFGRSEARAEDLSTREARARASCDGTRVLGSVAGLPCGVTPVFVATIQRPPRRAIDWTRPAPGSPTETSTTPRAALQSLLHRLPRARSSRRFLRTLADWAPARRPGPASATA